MASCDAYDESLVKDPPAADVDKLKQLLESFAKSVGKREELTEATKTRIRENTEAVIAGLPGSLPRVSSLIDDDAVQGLEMTKKVRGVSDKMGGPFHAHRPRAPSATRPHQGGGVPAQEERAAHRGHGQGH